MRIRFLKYARILIFCVNIPESRAVTILPDSLDYYRFTELMRGLELVQHITRLLAAQGCLLPTSAPSRVSRFPLISACLGHDHNYAATFYPFARFCAGAQCVRQAGGRGKYQALFMCWLTLPQPPPSTDSFTAAAAVRRCGGAAGRRCVSERAVGCVLHPHGMDYH